MLLSCCTGGPLQMQHRAQRGCQRFTTANWTGGAEMHVRTWTSVLKCVSFRRTNCKTTCDPSTVAAKPHTYTHTHTRVTTAEQSGLQELDLDVQKMGVPQNQGAKRTESGMITKAGCTQTSTQAKLKPKNISIFLFFALSLPTASSTRGEVLPFSPLSRRWGLARLLEANV